VVNTEKRTLLRNGVVLPMEGRRTFFAPGSVLIEDSTIVAVGPVQVLDADPRAKAAVIVDATGHAVIPGLHNCHMHSGLLRGTAEAMSLWDWLQTYVDPAHRAVTPEIAAAAAALCYAESVLAGSTSVMDMWRYLEGAADAAATIGLRATLVPYVADAPGYDYFETLESNRRLLESHGSASDGRVRTWVGLEHLFYCTPETLGAASVLAREFDTGLHVHSSETQWEVEESLRRYGRRPIEQLRDLNILSPRTVVAHAVWLNDAEVGVLAATGASVAHCPCSNMKLASGAARIGALRAAGVNIGLGTDGEKENNTLDILAEMKFAALLEKVSTLDPTAGDPWDVLRMATLDGARALGLDALTGSLEPGKRADIVTVELRTLHTTPVLYGDNFNVAAHIVFSATGRDVDHVWVDGRLIVEGGHLLTANADAIRVAAQGAAEELFRRMPRTRGASDPPHSADA
jgi:5-methylthioadenosine/S-adenosylhomocysteine deaminase